MTKKKQKRFGTEKDFTSDNRIALESQIVLGDLSMSSNSLTIEQLTGLLLEMLKDKNVQKYLGLLKQNKLINGGSYFG